MKRAKEVLPNTPMKRVKIIQELANSPTCKKILENDETFISPNLKRKLEVSDTLLSLQCRPNFFLLGILSPVLFSSLVCNPLTFLVGLIMCFRIPRISDQVKRSVT
jgi:hypothetical protein